MERLKTYTIGILLLACGVMAFMLFCRQPRIEKSTTYITLKAKVSGATTATIKPNGEIVYTGDHMFIDTAFTDRETIKYSNTAFLFFNLGYGVQVNPNFLAPSKDIIIHVENWSVGATVNLRPYLLSLDYQHLNAYPDLIQLKVSVPLF